VTNLEPDINSSGVHPGHTHKFITSFPIDDAIDDALVDSGSLLPSLFCVLLAKKKLKKHKSNAMNMIIALLLFIYLFIATIPC
jgi:hypothetical protein